MARAQGVLFCKALSHDMLQETDVPPGANFRRLNDIPGNDGKLSLVECLPEIKRAVSSKPDKVFFDWSNRMWEI